MTDSRYGKIKTSFGGVAAHGVLAAETSSVLVDRGATNNKWFGYETYEVLFETGEVYYQLLIDGDEQGYFETKANARKYAKHLF